MCLGVCAYTCVHVFVSLCIFECVYAYISINN